MTNGPASIDLTNADSAPNERSFMAVLDINRAELSTLVTDYHANPNKLVSLSLGPPEDHATMVTELERQVFPIHSKDRHSDTFYHKYYLPSDPEHPEDAETRQKMIFGAASAGTKHVPALLYIVEKLNPTGEFEPASAAAMRVSEQTLQALMPTLPKVQAQIELTEEDAVEIEVLPEPVHFEQTPLKTLSKRKFDAAITMLRKVGKELITPPVDPHPWPGDKGYNEAK